MSKKFSELKIIFSNCLVEGSAWTDVKSSLIKKIREILYETSGIEFKAVNTNNVSGDHSAFTITIVGTYFNLKSQVNKNEMMDLDDIISRIAKNIQGFSCSEARVEHTRHLTTFRGLSHPQLARIV